MPDSECAPNHDCQVDLEVDLERYVRRLASERRYSTHSLKAYRQDLALLRPPLIQTPWTNVEARHLRRLLAQLASQGLSPRSLARKLSAWRGFFDFLLAEKTMAHNPARQIKAPKMPSRLPKALAADDSQRLLDFPQHGPSAARDLAMMELFYSSGLRLSELIQLDCAYHPQATGWLDAAQAQVQVLGKGSKRRTIPVGAKALSAIDAWLKLRKQWLQKHPDADQHALFIGTRGKRISARTIQQRLASLGLASGLPSRLHPHVFRHSFASDLLQSSGDLRAVQEMLGHASIASTQIYTALDFQRLAAVYDQAHPRAARRRA
ncbi:MAG: tyrosine recombinase XerC [Betaproteobacteria bacterium]|jgi:integrase/recombinase XerC|nr:tyrosine recombinase XerC [Pseudomonadota bacterium]NBP34410.1 tyrosine recombinase XerC [Betaproteobacteria bacterium]NBP36909.1 tyrosine recombinase XerC [Betaproteobacteria bacterium]NBQ77444.1 tyrosine recombinase XerC [Betaproteobacteria bacterium]NBS38179.1 tyrosine recombinase XerC [Betaproteobacteria bacterium]